MKQSQRMLLLCLAAMLTFSLAFAATASAKMMKKVDNFILFLDHSGSMGMTHAKDGKHKKINMALEVLRSMNNAVPALDFNAAFFTFAPFGEQVAPGMYDKTVMADSIGGIDTGFDIFGRRTPLGDGQAAISPVVGRMNGKTALIMVTDGLSNRGADPVAAARSLRDTHGDALCVHVVSVADTAKGMATIEAIRKIFPCSVTADYASLTAPGGMEQYVKDVFYEEVKETMSPAPAPAPAPAPVVMAKETITLSLNFGFDKADITDEMIPALEQVLAIVDEDPNAKFEIAGHTDSSGPSAYNQGLSERRAKAVVDWLTKEGVKPARLNSKGYGESMPKYDNGTREGRALNRRVEIKTM